MQIAGEYLAEFVSDAACRVILKLHLVPVVNGGRSNISLCADLTSRTYISYGMGSLCSLHRQNIEASCGGRSLKLGQSPRVTTYQIVISGTAYVTSPQRTPHFHNSQCYASLHTHHAKRRDSFPGIKVRPLL